MANSDFLQDHLQRAEVGERRLQEVEPDKGGEPQPIEAVEVGQQKADQDEDARKSPEDHFHNIMYLLPLSCHGEKPKARLSIDVDLARVAARRASIANSPRLSYIVRGL